jgi:hypothetical protein
MRSELLWPGLDRFAADRSQNINTRGVRVQPIESAALRQPVPGSYFPATCPTNHLEEFVDCLSEASEVLVVTLSCAWGSLRLAQLLRSYVMEFEAAIAKCYRLGCLRQRPTPYARFCNDLTEDPAFQADPI